MENELAPTSHLYAGGSQYSKGAVTLSNVTTAERMASTPSGLSPTASDVMDVDSPQQMQIEIQSQTLDEQ